MTNFADVLSTDPPRLVVLFQRGPDGDEQFQWGVVHIIPLLSLVGAIVRVQAELVFRAPEPCEASAFVLVWDAETRTTVWFVHPDIPIDPLVGILEAIKMVLIGSRVGQHAAAQQTRIIGPDGNPLRM